MNAVSYVIVFAFHPDLDMQRIIIERSFSRSIEKLTTIDNLTAEQLKYKDTTTLKQLRDCAISVANKKNKITISEMFSTELEFASDCLINWFNSKYKNENLQLSNDRKRNYEIENPINWETDKCWIYNFPLHINPTMPNALKEKMSYDFIIEKEYKFLRNIFSKEEFTSSDAIKNIEFFMNIFLNLCKLLFICNKVSIQ